MATKIVKCPSCNTENTGLENFCRNCGTTLDDPFQNQQNQQMQQPMNQGTGTQIPGAEKKMLVGILAIALGVLGFNFGVHKFILGYQNEGFIMIGIYLASVIITIATCGLAFPILFIPMIMGVIEGIMYLTKSDEEFVQTYINNKKPWF